MKKCFSILLTLILCFANPCFAFAVEPSPPNLEGLNNDEAAALVEDYNKAVDEYNKQIDSDYEEAVQEYNEIKAYNEEAAAYNAKEDEKVNEIEAYNKAEQSRVDEINKELEAQYNEELSIYQDKTKVEPEAAQEPKYNQVVNDKETLYYDQEENLVLRSVAGNTAKDDIITYENLGTNEDPIWSNKYDYSGANNRYVNFSLISTIGKTTTGTDWDNDASKYSNKVYSTIADKNDVTEKPLDFSDEGEGRNLINYKTANIGLELCDSIIRTITNNPISTYYNTSNRNEELGKTESHITFRDFPTNREVFTALQNNGSVFIDPDTKERIIGKAINSNDYNICWFSVKYQQNGWRVSGVLLKNGVLVAPALPQYLQPTLLEVYVPQYKELKTQLTLPIKGTYLEKLIFTPKIEQSTIEEPRPELTTSSQIIEEKLEIGTTSIITPLQETIPTIQQQTPQLVVQNTSSDLLDTVYPVSSNYVEEQSQPATKPAPSSESIKDDATPLANGLDFGKDLFTPTNWALLNLIFMLVNIIVLLIIPRQKEYEEDQRYYRSNILGIIFAIAAILVFIFTQNIYLQMVIADKWTVLMGGLMIGGILNKIFGYKKIKN